MRWIYVLLITVAPGLAAADQSSYSGGHPLPDHGFCHIESPHVHAFVPAKAQRVLYRAQDKTLHFVGDPTAHGYQGRRVAYVGHHPIAASSYVHIGARPKAEFFCFINGPHHHAFAPAAELEFELSGDAHWFVGTRPADYPRARKRYQGMTRFYAEVDYSRPVIEVQAPAAYAFAEVEGVVVVPAPVAEASLSAIVRGPSLRLVAPSARVVGGVHADSSAGVYAGASAQASAGIEVVVPSVAVGGELVIGAEPVFETDRPRKAHRGPHRKSYRKSAKKRRRGRKKPSNPAFRNRHRRDFR